MMRQNMVVNAMIKFKDRELKNELERKNVFKFDPSKVCMNPSALVI